MSASERREVPPTAGLPPRWADWWPFGARAPLRPDGISHAQLECSGTACLVVALTALRRNNPRTEVVIPAYTCPLVALAVAHCGLRARLCDTVPGGFDFDPAGLGAACGPQTLAVVPTHLGGRVADVAVARRAADACGAAVVEDAAQAWGATSGGRPVGLAGDIGFFSLAVGKGITLYEGGVLVARDPAMRARLAAASADVIHPHAAWETRRLAELAGYTLCYGPRGLRWVYGRPHRRALAHGDWILAVGDRFSPDIPLHRVSRARRRVGERAAVRWPAYAAALRAQAQRRLPLLEAIPGVRVLQDQGDAAGTWPFLIVLLPSRAARDAALAALAMVPLGVTRLFIRALPDYDYLAPYLDAAAAVPNARDFAARTLTISNSLWLDDAGFARVLAGLRGALGHAARAGSANALP
jgi:dTDP-4-amino-4,6-dideoxygalactose transaminase